VQVLIHLIRHGETASNAERVFQTPDVPLNERGRRQAQRLARRLREAPIERVLASDFVRAEMTAREVAAARGVPLELTPLLHERNFGDLRGTAYAALGRDPFAADYAPPGGETWDAFHARVDRAWEEIVRLASSLRGELAVVTHGLVCASIVRRRAVLPEPLASGSDSPALRFHNASVTLLRGPDPWLVETLGCIRHLDAAEEGEAATSL
jgi:probable phosphoglycerate mutase